jgi:murein L,D-transpeptidase YafK
LRRSPLVRSLLTSAALVAALSLAGCNTDGVLPTNSKAMAPLSSRMLSDIEAKNMDKESPILVRIFKEESELEVWKQDRSGRYALLKTYPICRWSGELGPKLREGDRQAPEGFYTITPGQMNPNSQYYLAFDLGYPNAYDRSHGRTGAHLMVHGDCSSRGCYSMTDEQISEIYALGREAFFGGQRAFQVQAYPFRMTPQNLAKHRNSPHMAFWKMLKRGNDHFEVTKLEPKVNVCEKRYVFDAEHPDDPTRSLSFSAAGKCPVFAVSDDVVAAVRDKQRNDEYQTAQLVTRGARTAPVRTGADGGMHPVFVAAVKRNEVGVAPTAYSTASIPGTIPATVRPPRIPELAEAPLVTGNAIAPPPGGAHSVSGEPPMQAATPAEPVRVASAEPSSTPITTGTAAAGNFFSGLFSSSSTASDKKSEGGMMDRAAKFIGLRGSDEKPAPAATPKPRAEPKVAARPAPKPAQTSSNGAIRPKPAEAKPVETPPATRTVAQPAPAAAPQTPPASAIAGAAPVVPAGTFDSRWSAFR